MALIPSEKFLTTELWILLMLRLRLRARVKFRLRSGPGSQARLDRGDQDMPVRASYRVPASHNCKLSS